jgi:hypothetical protein
VSGNQPGRTDRPSARIPLRDLVSRNLRLRGRSGSGIEPYQLLHAATLVLAAIVLMFSARDQWFFGDEWDFIVTRDLIDGEQGLFMPHNEHWSTLPILVYRALLWAAGGLDHYSVFMIPVVAAHLALVHVLWRLLLRIGVSAATATALSAVFAVLGAGAENLLWAFQIGFVGSTLGGAAAVLVLTGPRPRRQRVCLAVACLVASLMCSGIGISAVVWAGATAFLVRRSWGEAAVVAGPPTALFVLWNLLFAGDRTTTSLLGADQLTPLPEYVVHGLIATASQAASLPFLAGTVFLIAGLALIALRREVRQGPGAAVAAGALASVAFFTINGLGRAELGVEQASSSRYVYIAVALLLPLSAVLLDRVAAAVPAGGLVVAVVALYLVAVNLQVLHATAVAEAEREAKLRGLVLASAELLRDGTPMRGDLHPEQLPGLTADDVRKLLDKGWLPDRPTPAAARAQARARLQVRTVAALSRPTGFRVSRTGDGRGVGPDGCVDLRGPGDGFAVLRTGNRDGRGVISIQAPPGSTGTLRIFSDDGAQSQAVPLTVDGSGRASIEALSTEGVAELVLTVPGSPQTQVCGTAPSAPGP